jgi:hypothetical protein
MQADLTGTGVGTTLVELGHGSITRRELESSCVVLSPRAG